jgi:cytoskeletal protein RodZ
MGQFGEELRKEREARGIALEAITDSTKISSRHLSALETEQFDRLPGGVFNRGIVRGYARVVGLDEDAWVNRFMSAYQASGMVIQDDADWVKFAQNVVRQRSLDSSRRTLRLRWAGVFLLLLLIAGLGWFVYHFVSHKLTDLTDGRRPPSFGAARLGGAAHTSGAMPPDRGPRDPDSADPARSTAFG